MSSCLLPPILWPHLSGMVRLRFLLPCKTSGQNSRGKDPQETEVVSTIGMEYHPNNQASNRSTSITSSQVKSNQVKPITSVNQWTKQPHNQSFTTFKYPTNSAIHITGDYPGGRLPRCLRQPLTNRLNIIFEGVWASHPWKSRAAQVDMIVERMGRKTPTLNSDI